MHANIIISPTSHQFKPPRGSQINTSPPSPPPCCSQPTSPCCFQVVCYMELGGAVCVCVYFWLWWLFLTSVCALSPQLIVCGGPEGMCVCSVRLLPLDARHVGVVKTSPRSLCVITKSYVLHRSLDYATRTLLSHAFEKTEQMEAKSHPEIPFKWFP